jgi:hypothetical protein
MERFSCCKNFRKSIYLLQGFVDGLINPGNKIPGNAMFSFQVSPMPYRMMMHGGIPERSHRIQTRRDFFPVSNDIGHMRKDGFD